MPHADRQVRVGIALALVGREDSKSAGARLQRESKASPNLLNPVPLRRIVAKALVSLCGGGLFEDRQEVLDGTAMSLRCGLGCQAETLLSCSPHGANQLPMRCRTSRDAAGRFPRTSSSLTTTNS